MGRAGVARGGARGAVVVAALVVGVTACGGGAGDQAVAPARSAGTAPAGSVAVRGTTDPSTTTEPPTSLPAPELPATSAPTSSSTTTSTTTTAVKPPPPTTKVAPTTTATTAEPTTTESPTYRPTMQWFESHSGILDAIRADDAQRLSAGTKWTVLATVCAKYQEDVATLTAALPVPNAVVDAGFRQAVNLLRGGVTRCISSSSSESYSGYTIASEQYLNPGIIAFMNAEAYRTQQRLPT